MVEAWAVVEDGVVADGREADRIVPWWSFTKTVLAAAALVLVRDGILSLDAPVGDKPYTLRHLLQHRSGLADYGGVPAYHEAVARNDEPWLVADLLHHADAHRLRYRTGEGWDYSNIGYLFVRRMIEALTGESLGDALGRLVLAPLGIATARIAQERADLAGVAMGNARTYHPGWVYHGLLVGSVEDAAMLLDGLLAGRLLPSGHLTDMLMAHVLPGPIPGRPWMIPGYGLGVMSGEVTGGKKVAGHTGGGPGSTIAVYRRLQGGPARTAAFFATGEDQARTEEGAFRLL
jgi:CubicO group peptidase (beta-lactamase class C family)